MSSQQPSGSLSCPYCGRKIKSRSALTNHINACPQRPELVADRARYAPAPEPTPAPIVIPKRKKPWEGVGRASPESGAGPANPPPSQPQMGQAHPLPSQPSSSHIHPTPPSQPLPTPPSQPFPPPPSQPLPSHPTPSTSVGGHPPPAVNTIRTQYHPKRGRPDDFTDLDGYNARRRRLRTEPGPSKVSETSGPSEKGGFPPYHPFKTRIDYDFAELMFNSSMKKEQVTHLLSLIKRCIRQEDTLTYDDWAGVEDSWKAASHLVAPFEHKEMNIPFQGEDKSHNLWSRDLFQWILDCLGNPSLCDKFRWEGEETHIFDGSKWERVVNDPWTGNDWFRTIASLPDDGVPVCLIIYSDKTQLSSFGTAQAHPVYAKIANLPSDIRNGAGLGGGRLVGWLPVVEDSHTSKQNSDYVDYKRVVWHESFRELLRGLKTYAKTGYTFMCADGVERRLFPCIFMISGDYEEQAIMAGIRGVGTSHPCPVCLVTAEDLDTYSDIWTYRDSKEISHLIEKAQDLNHPNIAAKAKKALADMDVRVIQNAFSSIENTNVHRALSVDRLHNYPGGLAKDRIVKGLLNLFKGKSEAQRSWRALIEERAAKFPRWRGLGHSNKILSQSAFQDANKWEDMACIFLYILHDQFPEDSEGYQLLRCLRIFLNLNALSSFENHTQTTINMIHEELEQFVEEVNSLTQMTGKPWRFPKMHLHMHMPHDILAKGATKHYTTKTFEVLHKALKEFYLWMTNFRDVEPQITNADHRKYVTHYINALIEAYEEELMEGGKEQEQEDELKTAKLPKYSFENITLKAPQTANAIPVSDFRFDISSELGVYAKYFSDFNIVRAMRNFIREQHTEAGFDFNNQCQIQTFRSIEVFFRSRETWDTERDILRCSPQFYRKERYDSVMIQTIPVATFARLLGIFIVKPASPNIPPISLALIIPYDSPIPEENQRRDKKLGLYRVGQNSDPKPEFIFARSIIRGSVLVPTTNAETDFFVFDVMDADMFLRVRQLAGKSIPHPVQ